jgi:4-hydroxymandelate oxidase
MEQAQRVMDFEPLARLRLSDSAWGYYASGANDEITLRENRAGFERIALYYRVLVDVSRRSPATHVLGQELSMPLMLAPTAFHKLAHADGEIASARAASQAGTVMILSTLSTVPVEAVVAAAPGHIWFQLYVYKDRGATRALVERVAAAGCNALVLTVDAPLLGRRERDIKNRFSLPAGMSVANMMAAGHGDVPEDAGGSGLSAYFASLIDPALTWTDLDWLRSITDLPIVVKGVVRADDARRAVDLGAAGVVVSNHGGRQLDTAPATIDALPAIADAVGGRADILLDGGVRRGTDVIKALALGARAVLIGRPVLWGLAAGGQAGVMRVLELLRAEIDLAMALCGCPSIADIKADLLQP